LKDETYKNMSLKKGKKKAEPPKPGLIYKTQSLWNHRPGLDQEAQFPTNLMSNDVLKNISILKICQNI